MPVQLKKLGTVFILIAGSDIFTQVGRNSTFLILVRVLCFISPPTDGRVQNSTEVLLSNVVTGRMLKCNKFLRRPRDRLWTIDFSCTIFMFRSFSSRSSGSFCAVDKKKTCFSRSDSFQCFVLKKLIKQCGAAFENSRLHFVFSENDVSSAMKVNHVIHRWLIL